MGKSYFEKLDIINNILMSRDEFNLAWLQGQQIANMKLIQESKPKIRFRLIKILSVCRDLFFGILLKKMVLPSDKKILLYCKTNNQKKVLSEIASELNNETFFLIDESIQKKIDFSLSDIVCGFHVLFRRYRLLTGKIDISPYKYILNSFSIYYFFMSYFYLARYIRLLESKNIKILVMSNDHSLQNRCLLFTAKYFGIKTAYLQHAHISSFFPPMDFDYAFLDGEKAKSIYSDIDPKTSVHWVLSGIMKRLPNLNKDCSVIRTLGISVNKLDDESILDEFVSRYIEKYHIIIRLHPAMKNINISQLSDDSINIHNAKDISLSDYFDMIDINISGDSSIHLESILSGVLSFYYNFGSESKYPKDYYGFLASGLVNEWSDKYLDIEKYKALYGDKHRIDVAKQYSCTYNSNKEDIKFKIVADRLKLLAG